MFCEQNKSAQDGLAYKASNENVDLIRGEGREVGWMSHFTCARIRKLDRTGWTNTALMGCSTGANMQASTQQNQLASSESTGKTPHPSPPHLLQGAGAWGNLPFIGTFKKIHIRRKEEEKKETGHKQ